MRRYRTMTSANAKWRIHSQVVVFWVVTPCSVVRGHQCNVWFCSLPPSSASMCFHVHSGQFCTKHFHTSKITTMATIRIINAPTGYPIKHESGDVFYRRVHISPIASLVTVHTSLAFVFVHYNKNLTLES
jgi:hypothetical protein